MSTSSLRWVLTVILVVLIVALLAYARGEPGGLGRTVDADEVGVILGYGT